MEEETAFTECTESYERCMNRHIFESEEFKNIHKYTIKEIEDKLNNINDIFCKTNDLRLAIEKAGNYFKYKFLLYDMLYEFLHNFDFDYNYDAPKSNNLCITVATGLDEYRIHTTYNRRDTTDEYKITFLGKSKYNQYKAALKNSFPVSDYCLLQIALYTIKKYKHSENNINEYLIKIVSVILDSLYEYERNAYTMEELEKQMNQEQKVEEEKTDRIKKIFDKQLKPTDFLWIYNTDATKEEPSSILFIGKGALGNYEYDEKDGTFVIDNVGGHKLEVKNTKNNDVMHLQPHFDEICQILTYKYNNFWIVGDESDLEYYKDIISHFYIAATNPQEANFHLISECDFLQTLSDSSKMPMNWSRYWADIIVVPKGSMYLTNQNFIDAIRFNKL